MTKENNERMILNITQFDTEDVIVTSGPGGESKPIFSPHTYEIPVIF